ncbi:MAG TPA: uracil-DNA glycosylase, partial [Clostridia bacterium]|nr:uracil-DNA glycosylase [Clostridia bacterium]
MQNAFGYDGLAGPGSPESKETLLASIAEEVVSCQKCKLGATRTKAVPGVGSAHAHICFVGEGP